MPTDKNQKRLPPQSIESELAVLGCILIDPDSFAKVLHHIDRDSFYKKIHSTIFAAMESLFEKNESIDIITLTEELKKNKQLDEIGGAYFITSLSSEAPTAANVEYYANIVKEKATLRNIIDTAISMSNAAYDMSENSTEVLDKAESLLFEISQTAGRGNFRQLDDLLHNVLDKISGDKTRSGVRTGFIDLDDKLSGLQKSDLIILAARPSMGKTALALNFARNAAVQYGHNVGFFSLEMSSQQLAERLITSEARVDSHLVRTGKLPQNEWKNLSDAAGVLTGKKVNIFIDDSPGLNIMELRAKARELVSTTKEQGGIDAIFVDYIQLLNAGKRFENRQQEISYISRSLKGLAKELDVPIVALSQLSRAPESRTDHRPVMSDLRESGAIEQDADVILFIFREYVYSRDDEDKGLGEIIIAKHRNGPTGLINVTFMDKYARFENKSSNQHSKEYYDGSTIPS